MFKILGGFTQFIRFIKQVMNMNCGSVKKYLSSWVDGESEISDPKAFEEHLAGCSSCQREEESFKAFSGLLRMSAERIEPSFDFDSRFWKKAFEREKEPWLVRILKSLETLVPAPNFGQVFAALTLALLIGGASGVVSATNTLTPDRIQGSKESIQYLSGFREFGGVPSPSVAGVYLKTVSRGNQS